MGFKGFLYIGLFLSVIWDHLYLNYVFGGLGSLCTRRAKIRGLGLEFKVFVQKLSLGTIIPNLILFVSILIPSLILQKCAYTGETKYTGKRWATFHRAVAYRAGSLLS